LNAKREEKKLGLNEKKEERKIGSSGKKEERKISLRWWKDYKIPRCSYRL